MSNPEDLSPERDLNLALTVASDVGRVIAAADTKIGFMLAAQGALLALLTQSPRGPMPASPWVGPGAVTVVVMAVIALTVMAILLIGLWPRTGGATRWVAFVSFRDGKPVGSRPDLSRLADDAWSQVATLSAVARSKFRWFRAAVIVGGIELAFVALWVVAQRAL